MRWSFILLLLLAVAAVAQNPMPRMTGVEPGNGKAGDVLTAAGENLDQAQVAQVFLTDGTNDLKVEVTDQTVKSIKFKIPPSAKAGRFALMLLTKGKEPKLIEQPVKVTIE